MADRQAGNPPDKKDKTGKNSLLGRSAELQAVKYLEGRGYRIVRRNWRIRQAEIDIIARHEGWLVFVEVKARSSGLFGGPAEAVDLKKQEKMARAASAYMALEKTDLPARFDVIAIGPGGLEHIKDAFESLDNY